MKNSLLALAFALGMMPMAALAQDTNAPPAMTDQQRQAMHQTFERFAQQEMQLHQQMRSQLLSSLSPVHLRVVGSTIGNLAIQQNPDIQTAARQIDRALSAGERQRVIAAHESFRSQSRQLHEQMRSQMQSIMPAGHPDMMKHDSGMMQNPPQDAGTILLMALSPHPMMDMMHGHMMEGMPHQ
jgi:hypothetical protein